MYILYVHLHVHFHAQYFVHVKYYMYILYVHILGTQKYVHIGSTLCMYMHNVQQ